MASFRLDQDYIDNYLVPYYAEVAIQTEIGGDSNNIDKFSLAGGEKGTYSFGIFQFDVGNNQLARVFLTGPTMGFTDKDIGKLSQHSGLSPVDMVNLSAKLKAKLADPVNQSGLDKLNFDWVHGLANKLQNTLSAIEAINPEFAQQIYASPELQLRLMDYDNQFHLDKNGKLFNWLCGYSVSFNLAHTTLQLDSGHILTGQDINNFIHNTDQSIKNLKGINTRMNALDNSFN